MCYFYFIHLWVCMSTLRPRFVWLLVFMLLKAFPADSLKKMSLFLGLSPNTFRNWKIVLFQDVSVISCCFKSLNIRVPPARPFNCQLMLLIEIHLNTINLWSGFCTCGEVSFEFVPFHGVFFFFFFVHPWLSNTQYSPAGMHHLLIDAPVRGSMESHFPRCGQTPTPPTPLTWIQYLPFSFYPSASFSLFCRLYLFILLSHLSLCSCSVPMFWCCLTLSQHLSIGVIKWEDRETCHGE